MPMTAAAAEVYGALTTNAKLFLVRAIDALPANELGRPDPPMRREDAVMAAVLIQLAAELALKAAFVREDGLNAILQGADFARNEADVVTRMRTNERVDTLKFEALKQRAKANGRFGIHEDGWDIATSFQTMRNRLVHIDFTFDEAALYDLKWELLHMLVHVVVPVLFESFSDPDEYREALGDTFFKLLEWSPYEGHIKKWVQLDEPLDCPACSQPWFGARELRCFRCGLAYDSEAGMASCPWCKGQRCVLYDKLNQQVDGRHYGKCLKCRRAGLVIP